MVHGHPTREETLCGSLFDIFMFHVVVRGRLHRDVFAAPFFFLLRRRSAGYRCDYFS